MFRFFIDNIKLEIGKKCWFTGKLLSFFVVWAGMHSTLKIAKLTRNE